MVGQREVIWPEREFIKVNYLIKSKNEQILHVLIINSCLMIFVSSLKNYYYLLFFRVILPFDISFVHSEFI